VRRGGVVAKPKAWRTAGRPWLLAVEDPQEPGEAGLCCSQGTHAAPAQHACERIVSGGRCAHCSFRMACMLHNAKGLHVMDLGRGARD
jgi:hypothetical protein